MRELIASAVGLAHDRHADDLDAEVEIAHHAADDGELLEVLLAEHGDVRLDGVEQLGDHRGDAAEVARPRAPAEPAR